VDLVRKLHAEGMGYAEIAEKFGVSRVTVGRICRYERRAESVVRWKRVAGA
jgi:DNA invertase Pin-like site-specific DNA recombinase